MEYFCIVYWNYSNGTIKDILIRVWFRVINFSRAQLGRYIEIITNDDNFFFRVFPQILSDSIISDSIFFGASSSGSIVRTYSCVKIQKSDFPFRSFLYDERHFDKFAFDLNLLFQNCDNYFQHIYLVQFFHPHYKMF